MFSGIKEREREREREKERERKILKNAFEKGQSGKFQRCVTCLSFTLNRTESHAATICSWFNGLWNGEGGKKKRLSEKEKKRDSKSMCGYQVHTHIYIYTHTHSGKAKRDEEKRKNCSLKNSKGKGVVDDWS